MSEDLSKMTNAESISKDTNMLCATEHTVWAGISGTEAYKDKIFTRSLMKDTSGSTTEYHYDDGYLHKLRIEILNNGKIVHQEDVTGDDTGVPIKREYLITAPGNWVVRFKSKSSGDCAKPTKTKEVGYFVAYEPATKDDANEQDSAGGAGQAPKPKTDYSTLAKTGLILGAALVVGKIISKKDKKAAEMILTTHGKYPRRVKFRGLDETRNYDGALELKGSGIRPAVFSENLRVGDVLLWNNGGKSRLLEITPKGKASLVIKTLTEDDKWRGAGQEYEQTVRKGRLVGLAEPYTKFNGVMFKDLLPLNPTNPYAKMAKRRLGLNAEDENEAETFEAVVVHKGRKPKGIIEKTMLNKAMITQANIESTIQELENKIRYGIISEDDMMNALKRKFGSESTGIKLFKKASNGEIRQWVGWVESIGGDEYALKVVTGVVDGKQIPTKGKVYSSGKQGRDAKGQAEFELVSKINKKRDEGYFDTIQEAQNSRVILPMLAVDFNKRGHSIKYPAIGQRKFDGVRCLAEVQDSGSVSLNSRKGKPFPHLNHLRNQIAGLKNLPSNVILDGELYSDTLTFQEVVGLVRRATLKAGDEEKLKQISYRLYDLIPLEDATMDFEDRYKLLTEIDLDKKRNPNLILTENIELTDASEVDKYHNQFVQEGYEGIMVRNREGEYGLNKRSKHLQKYKKFLDDEFEIVGYFEGTGNDAGTVIWVCKNAKGQTFKARPTGTREQRKALFQKADSLIGSTLTVRYFELTDDGIPRFPVGIAIRDYESEDGI